MMNTTQLGAVINFSGWRPTRAEYRALNPAWIRGITYRNEDVRTFLEAVRPTCPVIVLLNSEHEETDNSYSHWDDLIEHFCDEFRGSGMTVELINEWDLLGIPVDTVVRVLTQSVFALRQAGMVPLLGSVAGPEWPSALEEIKARCPADVWSLLGGACFHPYGQRPDGFAQPGWGFGNLREVVLTAHHITEKPVYVTEFGIKVRDAGGEAIHRAKLLTGEPIHPRDIMAVPSQVGQAAYIRTAASTFADLGPEIAPVACVFCWHDQVAPGHEQGLDAFGLIAAGDRRRPSYAAFQKVVGEYGEEDETMPTFVLGFKEIADAYPELVGQPREDEYGPWRNASLQRTSNGLLFWGDYVLSGSRKGFVDQRDGKRYAWNEGTKRLDLVPPR